MNLYIDSVHDTIFVTRSAGKKGDHFRYWKTYEYSLMNQSNIEKALNDFLDNELILKFKMDKINSLIFGDDLVSFNMEEIPIVSKSKLDDIFETRFKMYFPNYKSLYLGYSVLERNNDKAYYFFEIAKREKVSNVLDILKAKEINISNINYFSNVYASVFLNQIAFPTATLVIGKNKSEIFIVKNNRTIAVDIFEIGYRKLLEKEEYLPSSYNLNNDESRKFSACVKANFAANLALTDEMILSHETEEGLEFSIPREVRAIKGQSLETYNLKNNFRKFTSMIADFVEAYSQAPWFMPVPEINVFTDDEVFSYLEASAEETTFKYVKANKNLEALVAYEVNNNSLFNQQYKENRRKIDWAKFFSMEIGGKKKKA